MLGCLCVYGCKSDAADTAKRKSMEREQVAKRTAEETRLRAEYAKWEAAMWAAKIFNKGDLIECKVDKGRGIVNDTLWVRDYSELGGHWEYDVRFASNQVFTNTRITKDDGAIYSKRYEIVRMQQYEIEKVENK